MIFSPIFHDWAYPPISALTFFLVQTSFKLFLHFHSGMSSKRGNEDEHTFVGVIHLINMKRRKKLTNEIPFFISYVVCICIDTQVTHTSKNASYLIIHQLLIGRPQVVKRLQAVDLTGNIIIFLCDSQNVQRFLFVLFRHIFPTNSGHSSGYSHSILYYFIKQPLQFLLCLNNLH